MNIYPYVYIVTHNETGEFYIGSRWANKLPAEDDFLKVYKTSAPYIKNDISNFSGYVIAEFFTKESAYHFEQELINEYIGKDPLCLNRSCFYDKTPFILNKHTDESKRKMSLAKKGKPGPIKSAEHRAKLAEASRKRPFSDESKLKVSLANKGRPSPRKGKTLTPEHRAAMSAAAKARWANTKRKDSPN